MLTRSSSGLITESLIWSRCGGRAGAPSTEKPWNESRFFGGFFLLLDLVAVQVCIYSSRLKALFCGAQRDRDAASGAKVQRRGDAGREIRACAARIGNTAAGFNELLVRWSGFHTLPFISSPCTKILTHRLNHRLKRDSDFEPSQ